MIIYNKYLKYDEEAKFLSYEIGNFLGIDIEELKVYHMYQFDDIEGGEKRIIEKNIFDLKKGEIVESIPEGSDITLIRVKDNSGQYNQQEDMAYRFINNSLGIDVDLRYSQIYSFRGVGADDIEKIKSYIINPVERNEIDMDFRSFEYEESDDYELREIEGFRNMDEKGLEEFSSQFAMDYDDMVFVQEYFKEEERNPNLAELKVIDTYWSDHCRHTTFNTELRNIEVKDGPYKDIVEETLDDYEETREYVYGEDKRPICLMDLGTINGREIRKKGLLDDEEITDEINACSIEIDAEIDGVEEPWLLMFKNETHNHPTEIEPYGGAHTCIGGCIRDPLSGRSFVYQGMRITGAGNPRTPFHDTLENKLPQRYITQTALKGFSEYANQIGAPVGYAREYYDSGFLAKRMEVGALVAAAPKENVVREHPAPGDKIVLLGGDTGRDGLGAAVGSSEVQTEETLERAGAEVQKGNPFVERNIIRLFRRKEATSLIKMCNDFGAGGVSVAVGELADALEIDLDMVPTKYPGMNGYEIALSESQERMAAVVRSEDVDKFRDLCDEENVQSVVVATVTDGDRVKMKHKGELVVDLSRKFLDSNGASKENDVIIDLGNEENLYENKGEIEELLGSLNGSSNRNIGMKIDNTLGRTAVLLQNGGKNKLTPQVGMVARLPVFGRSTTTGSIMTHGYFPRISKRSTYHGGYCAVIDSVAKVVALGGDHRRVRLSFQEYFESMMNDPVKFGKPMSALLGAFKVMKSLDIPAIGGKDSMSGSFEDIHVPPTIISFAVCPTDIRNTVSKEFKEKNSNIYISDIKVSHEGLIDLNRFKESLDELYEKVKDESILSMSTVSDQGLLYTLLEMAFGNDIGFDIEYEDLYRYMPGTLIIETKEELDEDLFIKIGGTGNKVSANGDSYDLDVLKEIYAGGKGDIFDNPLKDEIRGRVYEVASQELPELNNKNRSVLIPVLMGATGEYDLGEAFIKEGFDVEYAIINSENPAGYEESIEKLIEKLMSSGILAIPNGEYYGERIPAMNYLLMRDDVIKAVDEFKGEDGLILGVGSGFRALVESGYFGNLEDEVVFEDNPKGSYISSMENFKIIGKTYFTRDMEIGYEYSAPLSGRILNLKVEEIDKLKKKVNIIGEIESEFIDGMSGITSIASKDNKVFGTLELIERMDEDLYQNIDLKGQPKHFSSIGNIFL